jgi:hypothetical protein
MTSSAPGVSRRADTVGKDSTHMTAANLERRLLCFPTPKPRGADRGGTDRREGFGTCVAESHSNVRRTLPDSPRCSSGESALMSATGEIAREMRRELSRGWSRSGTAFGTDGLARAQTPMFGR